MRIATTIAQTIVRIAGLIMITLGVLIWTGNEAVIPVHIAVGVVLILSLWVLAFLGMEAGVGRRFVVLAIAWGFITPLLGLTQGLILVGDAHVLIQVLHLLVGLGAIGQAENLARRIKRTLTPALRQETGSGQTAKTRKAIG
jgi:hypothetical protein